jgi:hypothetical protein
MPCAEEGWEEREEEDMGRGQGLELHLVRMCEDEEERREKKVGAQGAAAGLDTAECQSAHQQRADKACTDGATEDAEDATEDSVSDKHSQNGKQSDGGEGEGGKKEGGGGQERARAKAWLDSRRKTEGKEEERAFWLLSTLFGDDVADPISGARADDTTGAAAGNTAGAESGANERGANRDGATDRHDETNAGQRRMYNLGAHFAAGMETTRLRCYQFSQLLKRQLPQLYAHLTKHGMVAEMYLVGWFNTLFLYLEPMPRDTLDRVWDVFMVERSPKILFRVALAIMFVSETTLLAQEMDGIMAFINGFPRTTGPEFRDRLGVQALLAVAFKIKVSTDDLVQLERGWRRGNASAAHDMQYRERDSGEAVKEGTARAGVVQGSTETRGTAGMKGGTETKMAQEQHEGGGAVTEDEDRKDADGD